MEGLHRAKFTCNASYRNVLVTSLEHFPYVERIKFKPSKIGCQYRWEIGYCYYTLTGVMDLNFPDMFNKYAKHTDLEIYEYDFITKISCLNHKAMSDYVEGMYSLEDTLLDDKTWNIYIYSNCKKCENINIEVTVYYYNVLLSKN